MYTILLLTRYTSYDDKDYNEVASIDLFEYIKEILASSLLYTCTLKNIHSIDIQVSARFDTRSSKTLRSMLLDEQRPKAGPDTRRCITMRQGFNNGTLPQ